MTMSEDDFWDLVNGIVKQDGFEPFMEPERLWERLKPHDFHYSYGHNRTTQAAENLARQLRTICQAVEAA
jgi:hypothetical protein